MTTVERLGAGAFSESYATPRLGHGERRLDEISDRFYGRPRRLELPPLGLHKFLQSQAGHVEMPAYVRYLGGVILKQFHGDDGAALNSGTCDDERVCVPSSFK
jgi:hypothetical protein